MKVSKTTWAATIAWAALISAAGVARGDWAACWLSLATFAFAPLGLAILAALSPRRHGLMSAAEAEALAWSQERPTAPPRQGGQARPVEAHLPAWRPQPLSA